MGDETITTEERALLRAVMNGTWQASGPWWAYATMQALDALAAAEKRAEEGSAEALKITEAYEEALVRLRTDLARLQPLVDAAREYAQVYMANEAPVDDDGYDDTDATDAAEEEAAGDGLLEAAVAVFGAEVSGG